jgi:NitT/TauT family transport system substrate-binding protein
MGNIRSGIRTILAAAAITASCGLLGGHAPAADKVIVGVVSRGAPLQWPLYVAIEKGFLSSENIEIDIVAGQSSAGVMQQLASGSVNIGPPSTADSFRAVDKGAPIVVFRTDLERAPFMLMTKPDIKNVAQLKGKTITVGSQQGIDRFYLEDKLAREGLQPGEFDVISAGSTTARYSALMSGAVAGAVLTAPQYFLAQASGYNNLGPVEYIVKFPFTSYVAFKPWLESNRSVIVRFLKAYSKAVTWFNDSANKSEATAVLVKWGKGDPKDVAMTYDVYQSQNYFNSTGNFGESELASFIGVLKQLKYIEGSVESARLFDASLLAAAAKE